MSLSVITVSGIINGRQFMMNDANDTLMIVNKKFRLINVIENNSIIGEIFATEIKLGLFKSKAYIRCILGQNEYDIYDHDINGRKLAAVFSGPTQICQYEHFHKSLHDLHRYEICCADENALYIAVLAALRSYIVVYLKPKHNEICQYRVVHSVSVNQWLDKYDPNWENMMT